MHESRKPMRTVISSRDEARKVRLTHAQKARLEAMTDAEITAAAKSDPDNPPLTKAELAKLKRGGRPPLPEHERTVLDHFRATGPGWQTRLVATLELVTKFNKRLLAVMRKAANKPRVTQSERAEMKTLIKHAAQIERMREAARLPKD